MNRRRILFCVLLVALPLTYHLAFARAKLQRIDVVKAEIRTLRARIAAGEDQLTVLDEARQELDEVRGWLADVQGFLTTDETAPEFILDISESLQACGLTPRETSPGAAIWRAPLHLQEFQVVVQGPLESVFDFLCRIENERPLSRVTRLDLETLPSGSEVRAAMTLLRVWAGAAG